MLLVSPLPDETLYGFVARSSRLRGDVFGSTTSQSLFRHPDAGLHHDFPHHLAQLAVNAHGYLGSSQAIMACLTIAPYFLRFKPPAAEMQMQAAMTGSGIARLKHQLGLPASPCRARLPLRACRQCMKEDRNQHGIAFWRRTHQLPGTLFCSEHAHVLLQSSLRINRRGKWKFLLPEDSGIFDAVSPLEEGDHSTCLTRLASLNGCLLNQTLPSPYLRERMVDTYRHGLKAHGLLTKGGLLRTQTYLNLLHSRFRSIQSIGPFCHALGDSHQNTLLRMVRKPRTDFHPLYHLLLIDALFEEWERFVEVYAWEAGMATMREPPNAKVMESEPPANVSAFVAELARSPKNGPIKPIAKQYGLEISTAIRWAGKLGVTDIARRPKVLHHALKVEVVSALLRGEPQRDIARHTGLSRATIDRICQEEPERYAAWQAANMEWKRTKARADILAYLEIHPNASLADVRFASPPGYCWLRCHDTEWLRSVLPEKARSISKQAARPFRVDWAARDELCFQHLCRLAETVSFESWERLKPGTLLRKLPVLPFTPRLDRLPNSSALVDQILEAHIVKRRDQRK